MNALLNGSDHTSLRVLHVLRHPMGGLFRHVCDLIEGQQEAGIMTGVVCGEPPAGNTVSRAMIERLECHCGLGLHVVPMGRLPGVGDVRALQRIGQLVERLQPDILHGHGAKGGAYARLLPRRHDAVRIYTPHGGALHYSTMSPAGAVFLGMERLLMSRTDGFIFESGFSRRTYEEKIGKPSSEVVVIPNGVRPDEFDPVSADDNAADFIFVGELRTLKGISVLIEALAAMKREATLAIVGSGPDEAEFRAQADRSTAKDRISFLGAMPAREAFRRGRVVVMPSLAESLPYVALETIAAGKPFIASGVGAMPEVFGPDALALIQPGNPRSLRSALEAALVRPERLSDQAQRLRERVRTHFSTARMVGDVIEFYERLAPRKLVGCLVDAVGVPSLPEPSVRN